ncbi:MAG: hypothetical protein Q7R30_25095 [Acidobacteriota bacterium]|nr:hypothetical protein [Acidobacteriota bacterium]
MAEGLRTPLLDFFRRGEVARDVRLMAAQGALATRPLEQLGVLMILTSDSDSEIRATAEATLQLLPTEVLAGFIARSDVPTELREFFLKRGVPGDAAPAPDVDEPLLDTDETGLAMEMQEGETNLTFTQRLANMGVPEKMKCATKGTREMRSILIRDPNRMVAAAVLSCPKVNDAEVEAYAKMGNVSEEILRTIAKSRAWTKNYGVTLSLVKNSKTPVALSMNLMNRLNEADVKRISTDRNVPEALRVAARKKVTQHLR